MENKVHTSFGLSCRSVQPLPLSLKLSADAGLVCEMLNCR